MENIREKIKKVIFHMAHDITDGNKKADDLNNYIDEILALIQPEAKYCECKVPNVFKTLGVCVICNLPPKPTPKDRIEPLELVTDYPDKTEFILAIYNKLNELINRENEGGR